MKSRFPRPQVPGSAERTILRRTAVLMVLLGGVVFLPLGWRLYRLQITHHAELSEMAEANQTRRSLITAARGAIYDRNMNLLALSADAENLCIDPTELQLSGQDLPAMAEKLAELSGADTDRILELMDDTAYRYQIVARKLDPARAAALRQYIVDTGVTGVYLEPDTRRFYPEGTLAAQVIGFVGSDNTGLSGLESAMDAVLTGTPGRIVAARGNYGTEMLYHRETYQDPRDGKSLVLTIDVTVQRMLESRLREAIAQYDVQHGAFGIVMDVTNGDILAMCTLGSFDPNRYAEIQDAGLRAELERQYQAAMEAPAAEQEALLAQYNAGVAEARLAQWRNRVISDGYEPGSTFKTITLASALEEGAVTLDTAFYCSGSTAVKGRSRPLHCWRSAGHGSQHTAEALQNSCNVAFAQIGIALGGEKLYEYVQNFGLTEPTGIELPGEAAGIFFDEATLSNPDSYASLTSAAFGQTFKVTPLQLTRAIAAVVNGGWLLRPHIVSQVLSPQGEVLEEFGRQEIRQVISAGTSRTMCELLESVVSQGTAKNAQLPGYRIGGKTGTSEKVDVLDENGNMVEDKIVSFVGVAPMPRPRYIVLCALDTPSRETGLYISGGQMAAPTVREVLGDILPYLGVSPEETPEADVTMPDLLGFSLSQAKAALAERNLTARTVGDGDAVTGQTPAAEAVLPGGSQVILYFGADPAAGPVTVPELLGLSPQEANRLLRSLGLYTRAVGASGASESIAVTGQDPAPGTTCRPGDTVRVEFSDLADLD